MGPGPANAYPRVLAAQSLPLLGHMHPPFFKIMDDIQEGLKYLFQTDLGNTLLISGTGHAGMEACIANAIEPGQKIVVGNNGIWGMRVADLAARYGGTYIPKLVFICLVQFQALCPQESAETSCPVGNVCYSISDRQSVCPCSGTGHWQRWCCTTLCFS